MSQEKLSKKIMNYLKPSVEQVKFSKYHNEQVQMCKFYPLIDSRWIRCTMVFTYLIPHIQETTLWPNSGTKYLKLPR